VLLGAAALGAAAANRQQSSTPLRSALASMAGGGRTFQPDSSAAEAHERKYAVFRAMAEDQRKYRQIMHA